MRKNTSKLVCLLVLLAGWGMMVGAATVRINEVMASNGSTIADEDGDFEDWIELYNYGEDPVDLSGWGLSDSYNNPFKWTFPQGTMIGAGEYLLVWASGKDRVSWQNKLIMDFTEGSGFTTHDSSSSANTGNLVGDVVFSDIQGVDGVVTFAPSGYIELEKAVRLGGDFTIGYTFRSRRDSSYIILNSTEGFNFALGHRNATTVALWDPNVNVAVNQSISANQWHSIFITRTGSTVDVYKEGLLIGSGTWTGRLNIDKIGNMSTNGTWQGYNGDLSHLLLFPYALTHQEIILLQLGEYVHKPAHLHTNYSLSASGEEVILTKPDGTRVDELEPRALPRDISVGRVEGEGGVWFYFEEATPGSPNDTTAYFGILEPPTFSHTGSVLQEAFELQLLHSDPNVVIIYTLDGSEPNNENLSGSIYLYKNSYSENPGDPTGPFLESIFQSFYYDSPIFLENRSNQPDKLTLKSSTHHLTPNYFPSTPVRKGNVVRARAYKDNYLPSAVRTNSFFIFDEPNPYSIPIVSLTASEDHLFDYYQGVYNAGVTWDQWRESNPNRNPVRVRTECNYWRGKFGTPWEIPANFEFFEEGLQLVNMTVGFRVHGETTRMNPIKNLRIYSRANDQGLSDFGYRFFDQAIPFAIESNDFPSRIFLRSQHGSLGNIYNDVVFHRLMQPFYEGMQRIRFVKLFVNGEYWGLNTIRDRVDEHYFAQHFGLVSSNIIISSPNKLHGETHHQLFLQMRNFITSNDMAVDANYEEAKSMLDIRTFVDHLILMIYSGNTHYNFSGEVGFWRAIDTLDDGFADGRWRVFVKDFDDTLSGLNYLERRSGQVSHWAGFSPEFRALLHNDEFSKYFINRFADHLNSTFIPSRFSQIVDAVRMEVIPYLTEDHHRSKRNLYTNVQRSALINWGNQHPLRMRNQLRAFFDIGEDFLLTIQRTYDEFGHIRVNTLSFKQETMEIIDYTYPWTGTYFQGVPIELEALPEPGHRFVGWVVTPTGVVGPMDEAPQFYSTEPLISLDLSGDTTVEAVFEAIPLSELPVVVHGWDFEDGQHFLTPSFTVGGGALSVVPGSDTQVLRNTMAQDFSTAHLRVNNPLGATLTFALPTLGFTDITLEFLTRRSGQGAGEQSVSYTLNGMDWIELTSYAVFDAPPQLRSFDFSGIAGVADNADFAVRIAFAQDVGGTAGNNRFDDVLLRGVALPETNLPPVVTGSAPAFTEAVAALPVQMVVSTWFADDDPLTFSASSADADILTATVDDSVLTLTGVSAGETTVTVFANDGVNPSVGHSVRVLVYGAAHALAQGDYSFSEWSPLEPAGSYPANMLLVQSAVNDPNLGEPLLFAYRIPANDAAATIDAEFPYNASARTRINGLDEDGISFINTGRGRDVGAAVLSLDTSGISQTRVSWTGGTVFANTRVYGIRLQYRVGLGGAWTDVLDGGVPIEYVRATDDDAFNFPPVVLPAYTDDQPLVQVRWIYHHISGTSGARAMLRLDDIEVTSGAPGSATNLAFAPGLPAWLQSGVSPGAVEVRALDNNGVPDVDYAGSITLSLLGSAALSGTLTVQAQAGVAVFDDWQVSGADGTLQLLATASGLSPAVSDTIFLSTFAVLLPGGDADWTANANWTGNLFPNAPALGARIPAPASGDRNVNLRAPVTIGTLIAEIGDTSFRNRIRDRSTGNTLTFDGGASEARLRVPGTGSGFIELQNEAGTLLATDLRLTIDAIEGDPEYGALRLRETWTGPGGLIKDGAGMASLTGDGKWFTGEVRIEQGVLAFSEPATAINASGVTVTTGGQLRLVSASSEVQPVRSYSFGGQVTLSGYGRSGVPDSYGMGVLGALRYDPGSQNNWALLSNSVHLPASADVHVDGTRNTLQLSGAITGTGTLGKTGGGLLVLSGGGSGHSGSLLVHNGSLRVTAQHPSPVSIAESGELSGTGTVGSVSGSGTLSVYAHETLTATSSAVARYRFGPGAILRLTGASPLHSGLSAGHTVELFLEDDTVPATLSGGFFSDSSADLAALTAGATWILYLPDPEGEVVWQGTGYSIWQDAPEMTLQTVSHTLHADSTEVPGTLLQVQLGQPAATGFAAWVATYFPDPLDQANPLISGPEATPLNDGVPNLLKYALGLGALDRIDATRLFKGLLTLPDAITGEPVQRLYIRFHRDESQSDITYRVLASTDLVSWTTVLYDSSVDPSPNNDGEAMIIVDEYPLEPDTKRFIRLRVDQVNPGN